VLRYGNRLFRTDLLRIVTYSGSGHMFGSWGRRDEEGLALGFNCRGARLERGARSGSTPSADDLQSSRGSPRAIAVDRTLCGSQRRLRLGPIKQ
jgi:hypothetical protein